MGRGVAARYVGEDNPNALHQRSNGIQPSDGPVVTVVDCEGGTNSVFSAASGIGEINDGEGETSASRTQLGTGAILLRGLVAHPCKDKAANKPVAHFNGKFLPALSTRTFCANAGFFQAASQRRSSASFSG